MSDTVSRQIPPLIFLGIAAVAVVGGLLAGVPTVLAWEAVGYVCSWFGLGTVDPTWNDGDGTFTLMAVAAVAVIFTAIGFAGAALARASGARRRGWLTVVTIVAAAGVALVPSAVIFQLQ